MRITNPTTTVFLGLLAAERQGVDPRTVIDALEEWARSKPTDLGAFFVQRGLLQAHECEALLRLLPGPEAARTTGSASDAEPATVPMSNAFAPDTRSGFDVETLMEAPGRYEFLEEYGRGGMGRILLVRDRSLKRDIALKELLPSFLRPIADPDPDTATPPEAPTAAHPSPQPPTRASKAVIERFLQEARITGRLEHPSIVPVYELGYRVDGTLYYTMKLVRGRTLTECIREAPGVRERVELLPHFLSLCQAIAYAHSCRVIHRDIKPDNVMIGEYGETVVLDWGLAKAKREHDVLETADALDIDHLALPDTSVAVKTAYGFAFGTPAYMSPEQALGLLDQVDELSDVYSLGSVLYELLSGQSPYAGKPQAVLNELLERDPEPLEKLATDAPPELIAICKRAMSRDRTARYPSAKALADEIQRFLSGALVQSYEYTFGEYFRRFLRRRRLEVASAAVTLAAIIGVCGLAYLRVLDERDGARAAAEEAQQARREEAQSRQLAEQSQVRAEAEAARAEEALAAATSAEALAQKELYFSTIGLAAHYLTEENFEQARAQLARAPEEHRNWEWGWLNFMCHQEWLRFPLRSAQDRSVCDMFWNSGIATIQDHPFHVNIFNLRQKSLRNHFSVYNLVESNNYQITEHGFSPDGRFLALFTPKHFGLLNIETGEKWITSSAAATDRLRHHFSPDGSRLAVVEEMDRVAVWNVDPPQHLTTLRGLLFVRPLLNQDGTIIAALGDEVGTTPEGAGTVILAQADTGAELATLQAAQLSLCAFMNTGTFLYPRSNRELAALDTETGEEYFRHEFVAPIIAVAASPTAAAFAVSLENGEIHLLHSGDTGARRQLKRAGVSFPQIVFSEDGQFFAAAGSDRAAYVWELAHDSAPQRCAGHESEIAYVSLSPDGRLLATQDKSALRIWNLHSNNVTSSIDAPMTAYLRSEAAGVPKAREAGAQQTVPASNAAEPVHPDNGEFGPGIPSPGGTFFLNATQNGFHLLECASGRNSLVANGHDMTGMPGVISHNDDTLAVLQVDHAERRVWVDYWGLQPGEAPEPMATSTQLPFTVFPEACSLNFSNDDTLIAAVVHDWFYLCDARSGEVLRATRLRAVSADNCPLKFSPEDDLVALAIRGGRLALFDPYSEGTRVDVLPGHAADMTAIAYAPDGERLVTGAQDGSLLVWDARAKRELLNLPPVRGPVQMVAYTGASKNLTVCVDGKNTVVQRAFPWNADTAARWQTHQAPEGIAPFHPDLADEDSLCLGTMFAEFFDRALEGTGNAPDGWPDCAFGGGAIHLQESGIPVCPAHGEMIHLEFLVALARAAERANPSEPAREILIKAMRANGERLQLQLDQLLSRWIEQNELPLSTFALAEIPLQSGQPRAHEMYGLAALRLDKFDVAAEHLSLDVEKRGPVDAVAAFALAKRGSPEDVRLARRLLIRSTNGTSLPPYFTEALDTLCAIPDALSPEEKEQLREWVREDPERWQGLNWAGSLDDALERAAAEDKYVLLVIDNPDTYYGKRLREEVFSNREVFSDLSQNYIVHHTTSHDIPGLEALRLRVKPAFVVMDSWRQVLNTHQGYLAPPKFDEMIAGPGSPGSSVQQWAVLPLAEDSEMPSAPPLSPPALSPSEGWTLLQSVSYYDWGVNPAVMLGLSTEQPFLFVVNLQVKERKEVSLEIANSDLLRCWLNGVLLHEDVRGGHQTEALTGMRCELNAGDNWIVGWATNPRETGRVGIGIRNYQKLGIRTQLELHPLFSSLPRKLLPPRSYVPPEEELTDQSSESLTILNFSKADLLRHWRETWAEYGLSVIAIAGLEPVLDEDGKAYAVRGKSFTDLPICRRFRLQNGDIVVAVNGEALADGLNYTAYSKKFTAMGEAKLPEWNMDIIRQGKPHRIIARITY